jgi:hypothetical protein
VPWSPTFAEFMLGPVVLDAKLYEVDAHGHTVSAVGTHGTHGMVADR